MVKLTDADRNQTPSRKGRQERIEIKRPGKPAQSMVTRVYQPSSNDFSYTAVGRQFYSRLQSSYVVQIPVRHHGTRASGQPYSRDNTFPLKQPIVLPGGLNIEQRDLRIKDRVLQMFGASGVVGEYSDEEIRLVPDGIFSITEMVTETTDRGTIETEVVTRDL
jgi:hypothetical protein